MDIHTNYLSLSKKQRFKYQETCGYEYGEKAATEGKFSTDRPFNKCDWKYSPWWFSYKFDSSTGFLFCEMSHRMTSNSIYGWDYEGEELAQTIIERTFPLD